MGVRHSVSRRHLLAMSAATGSLALGGGFDGALAQAGKRIERLDPSLDAIIDTSAPIQEPRAYGSHADEPKTGPGEIARSPEQRAPAPPWRGPGAG
jgi:hypothetical protein